MDFGTPLSLRGGLPTSVVRVMDIEDEIKRLTRLQRATATALAKLKKQLPGGSSARGGGARRARVNRKNDGTFDIVDDADELDDEDYDSVGILSDNQSR